MPKLKISLPNYRRHKVSGQAMVTLEGRDSYLGPHSSQSSIMEYDRLIAEWLANGRRLSVENGLSTTVEELLAAFWEHAENYYRVRSHVEPSRIFALASC